MLLSFASFLSGAQRISPSLLAIYHLPCKGSPISVDDEKWPLTTSSWKGFQGWFWSPGLGAKEPAEMQPQKDL